MSDNEAFAKKAERVLRIFEELARKSSDRGGVPLKARCTVCQGGYIHFSRKGPRAAMMYCDGPGCDVQMMS